jgi:16S rRNA pseudouridine516 synthase
MRIDKYLSHLKYERRSLIKKFLSEHDVRVENIRVKSSDFNFDPIKSECMIDGIVIPYVDEINLVIYKPIGYLSANQDQIHPTVFEFIKSPYDRYQLKIAGRLDLDAEGLLILTTNGQFVHEITHPKKHLDKIYEVTLNKPFIHQLQLKHGVMIKDEFNQHH